MLDAPQYVGRRGHPLYLPTRARVGRLRLDLLMYILCNVTFGTCNFMVRDTFATCEPKPDTQHDANGHPIWDLIWHPSWIPLAPILDPL